MQHEKNPNGGYLRPNQYGLFGVVDVTPELMAEIQKTGKMSVSVSSPETRTNPQNGEQWQSARIALKPYQPAPRPEDNPYAQQQRQAVGVQYTQGNPNGQAIYNQAPVQQAPMQPNGYQQAPMQQPQQAPNQGWNGESDQIPF